MIGIREENFFFSYSFFKQTNIQLNNIKPRRYENVLSIQQRQNPDIYSVSINCSGFSSGGEYRKYKNNNNIGNN